MKGDASPTDLSTPVLATNAVRGSSPRFASISDSLSDRKLGTVRVCHRIAVIRREIKRLAAIAEKRPQSIR
jgi:hypothetical protein